MSAEASRKGFSLHKRAEVRGTAASISLTSQIEYLFLFRQTEINLHGEYFSIQNLTEARHFLPTG